MPQTKAADSSPDKDRGVRLKKARLAKGFTQRQMAEKFGVTEQAYQHYEYGRDIRASTLIKICYTLECSPSWLLGMDEEGERLVPDDPVMLGLRRQYEALNAKGQKKLSEYADDLRCNPKYSAEEGRLSGEE